MNLFIQIIDFLNKEYISAIASASSIASLIISILVLFGIRNIRQYYIFTARVPEIKEKLTNIASAISDQFNTFDGYNLTVYTLLGEAEVSLKSLNRKTNGTLKKESKILINTIRSIGYNKGLIGKLTRIFKSENTDRIKKQEKLLQNIYISLHKIIAECVESYEDAKWEK